MSEQPKTGNEPAGEAPLTPGAGWHRAGGEDLTRPRRKRRRGGGGGWGSGNREAAMVPDAEFSSYYGRQIIKSPTWKNPEVPVYFFLGGAAGTSSVIAALAEFTGRPKLARNAEYAAGVGALASVVLLIDDLGRPERFLHMLRVFKPTSPLSVGSYILSPFSALASAAAAVRLLDLKPVYGLGTKVLPFLPSIAGAFPVLRKGAAVGAAAFGGPMATYTAVLIANTAVPSWHAPHDELPFVFAGSAMAAGGGITMALTPVDEAGPSRKVALTGVAVELAAMHRVEHGHGIVSEPYHLGKAGKLLRAAKAATVSGAGITALLGRTRPGSVVGGVLLAAGSLLTRMGVFEAGMQSAKDPKYTVIPQRERLEARQAEAAARAGTDDPHEARSVVR
ncbi:Formate-dependent nitrite reductase, membrane component [Modestobacter italicus]|uniref:Formate-dependent nitrite reductase, membrane component n=1 Tax=Modestobacter italicus (strain DSM 44449 / CECT 9708 / BC 501) TaxID=2732864 RepID=I4ER54_MODI5|nr:NrfD/PsrC family molybdoenzyme membrane anchor subunit [Modestobacter marinus]CCH85867.1 Formate-dependent nitrite reductase, membrane component [Modestobacter marinus]